MKLYELLAAILLLAACDYAAAGLYKENPTSRPVHKEKLTNRPVYKERVYNAGHRPINSTPIYSKAFF